MKLATCIQIRKTGYSFAISQYTPGGSVLAASLPVTDQGNPLVIGIAGIAEVQKKRRVELAKILHQTIASYFKRP